MVQRLVSLGNASEGRVHSGAQSGVALVKVIRVKAARQRVIGALKFFSAAQPADIEHVVMIPGAFQTRKQSLKVACFTKLFSGVVSACSFRR